MYDQAGKDSINKVIKYLIHPITNAQAVWVRYTHVHVYEQDYTPTQLWWVKPVFCWMNNQPLPKIS